MSFTECLLVLGDRLNILLKEKDTEYSNLIEKTSLQNNWFDEVNIVKALDYWAKTLTEENLSKWTKIYDFSKKIEPQKIYLATAGNIPLVGLHDILCVLMSGHILALKGSSKDMILTKYILDTLINIDSKLGKKIEWIKEFSPNNRYSAYIATGSNNSARYFEYYFKDKPYILRKNRTSVAVLSGEENDQEIKMLTEDIFAYYGLGCRNISKLFVPKDFDIQRLFGKMSTYDKLMKNQKYMNNYNYTRTIWLMNSYKFLENGFFLIKEDESLFSPIASLFYEEYEDKNSLKKQLDKENKNIQCISSNDEFWKSNNQNIKLGDTQNPKLWEYADGVDTLKFLLKI